MQFKYKLGCICKFRPKRFHEIVSRKNEFSELCSDLHHDWCSKEIQWTPWRGMNKRKVFTVLPLPDLDHFTDVQ
jgi:hypothetical protein